MLVGGVEFGDEAVFFGIEPGGQTGVFHGLVTGALAEEGELKEVRLFAARGAEATGQADEVKEIPARQQHPPAGGRRIFGRGDEHASDALQALDDALPVAPAQPNQ